MIIRILRSNISKFVIIVIIIFIGYLFYLHFGLYRGSGKDRIFVPLKVEELPLYFKISSSSDSVDKELEKRLIDFVKTSFTFDGITAEKYFSEKLSNFPEEFRTWECYSEGDKYYVCFAARVYLGNDPLVYIWTADIEEDRYNPVVRLLRIEGSGSFDQKVYNDFPVYEAAKRVLLSRDVKTRRVLLFFIDRELYTYNDREYMEYCLKIASKRYGISIENLRKIIASYNSQVDNYDRDKIRKSDQDSGLWFEDR